MGGFGQVFGHDAGGQTKACVVDGVYRLLIVVYRNDAGHGCKQLFLVDCPLVVCADKQRRVHVKAWCGHVKLFATAHEFATFLFGKRHVVEVF